MQQIVHRLHLIFNDRRLLCPFFCNLILSVHAHVFLLLAFFHHIHDLALSLVFGLDVGVLRFCHVVDNDVGRPVIRLREVTKSDSFEFFDQPDRHTQEAISTLCLDLFADADEGNRIRHFDDFLAEDLKIRLDLRIVGRHRLKVFQ